MRLNNIFIGLLSIFVFYGCGGGGGGSSEPDIPQAASLSFSSSATEVDKGDSITLSWSTSGLTSCSAFSDPNNTFSGSIPLSGSQEVTITSAGNHNFLINCSGNNGNKAIKDIDVVAYNTVDIQGTIYYSTDSTGALSLNNEQVNSQTGRDFPSEEDVFNYLCYAPVSETLTIEYDKSLSTILSNVDIDNDDIPDANLKGPFSSVYKNIASNSFGFNEVPTDPVTLSENFTPDLFLFDLHESLEKNIDLDNDGVADLNITRSFSSTSGTLSPSEIIIFNIQIDPDNNPELVINRTDFNKDMQLAEFELLNFDSNYDGVADLNIDTDGDGIADKSIDQNNDCYADFSYVDGEGVTVSGAEVRLNQFGLPDDNGNLIGFGEDKTSMSDENGVFRFEGVRSGTEQRIWIKKELEDRNIHIIRMLEVNNGSDLWNMGAFPLTSAPLLMGFEVALNESEPEGQLGRPYGGESGFWDSSYDWEWNMGDKFALKLFFEDPNKLDIYRKVPSAQNPDGGSGYEYIFAARPEITESGFSESLFEYELRPEGCFNLTLNSYNPSWNGELEYMTNYCLVPADDQLTNVFDLKDDMIFNNTDSRGFYTRSKDLRIVYGFGNDNKDISRPPTGYIVESVQINSTTYEHPVEQNIPMWHHWDFCMTNQKSRNQSGCSTYIEEAEDSNSIELKTNVSKASEDVEGYLTTFWEIDSFEISPPERVAGDQASFNFEDDAFPNYEYQIIGGVCITENEPDGYCRDSQIKYLLIDYEPLSDKAPSVNEDINLVINGENFKGYGCMMSWQFEPCQNYNQIFQVGDTLNIELFADDPNGLSTEFKVSPPRQVMSDWKPETTQDTYIIQENDRGDTITIAFCWRNNDGVANSWKLVGSTYSENDGCHNIRLRVSE